MSFKYIHAYTQGYKHIYIYIYIYIYILLLNWFYRLTIILNYIYYICNTAFLANSTLFICLFSVLFCYYNVLLPSMLCPFPLYDIRATLFWPVIVLCSLLSEFSLGLLLLSFRTSPQNFHYFHRFPTKPCNQNQFKPCNY